MTNNFITNSKEKTLSGRLNRIIKMSTELRWLVGFFYFSGWQEVYKNLKTNTAVKARLLVGLEVGIHLFKIFEHDGQGENLSSEEYFNDFMTSMGFAINNQGFDTQEFYEQIKFFVEMLQNDRLIIRKTKEPNHAKLYLFEMNEEERLNHNIDGYLITGSSNLTQAGLRGQQEFNVEIKDYGYADAVKYFEDLWEEAIPITEIEERKKKVIEFIQHRSQVAAVSPFEAYALILKTFLDLQNQKKLKTQVEKLLEDNGFKKFQYQIDAVNQALGIIEKNNGVIIADVVGLGKSIIAALIARNLDTKGLIICPPGLIGDRLLQTGWWGYVKDFDLKEWEVESRGKLQQLFENLQERGDDYTTVIIDEAHSFRNQDTADYEALAKICQGKQVILLSATPFNNSPADIFSLLKLFIVPGLSTITLDNNLEALFRSYDYQFKQLSYILKNYKSKDPKKRKQAESKYLVTINADLPVDPKLVRNRTKELSTTIKETIAPVVIRRNRIDLKEDFQYNKEVGELSSIEPPKEMFYRLSENQSKFYDRIVSQYFAEDGIFSGAIYQPSRYEEIVDEDNMDKDENRRFQQQRNLYDFMRRLLVKRFESSFGAFQKSIDRFIRVHKVVLDFIESSGGKFILDRDLMEKIYEYDSEDIDAVLERFENDTLNKKTPKNTTVYNVNKFKLKKEFLKDIQKDLALFEKIREEMIREDLVNEDPKRQVIYEEIKKILKKEPERKVVLFSEYTDTVRHLTNFFRDRFKNEVLICDGTVSKNLAKDLERNFNAQYGGTQYDDFKILITSDKLSEGFNLNRAGAIINYDIPWNPTRVIQRVGRINRIGTKVFDKLFLYNFFPSEIGADYVKSREIAEQKMFMIHNALGEDVQIFDVDEQPSASGLFQRMNANPEDEGEVNVLTRIRNEYEKIKKVHPEVIKRIEKLPNRVKTAKNYGFSNVNVLKKKGLALFPLQAELNENEKVTILPFSDFLESVRCKFSTKPTPLSDQFWAIYDRIKSYKEKSRNTTTDQSLEKKAVDNLKVGLKMLNASEEETRNFVLTLIKDIRTYFTLPKYTLRRLGFTVLTPKSSKKDWAAFWQEVNTLKKDFGTDYLDKLLEKVKDLNEEVIIAVENQSESI